MRDLHIPIIFFLFGATFSALLGVLNRDNNYVTHQEVVKHGCASYHPKTGKFTWTNESSGDTQ